jgi:hypothetical protein
MRLNLDMNILRHMTDGVVVLDRFAQIVAFNKIAEPWTPRCQAMSAALKRLIDEERQGRLVLPLFIELQTGQSNASHQRADAWLCKNGRNEYAIFIVSPNPAHHTNAPIPVHTKSQRNLLALVGGEVREQLFILRALIPPQGSLQPAPPETIAQQCKKVEQLMQEITDLSQLLEHDEVFAGERLSVPDLIENILVSLPPHANQATIALQPGTDPLGPVYGNGAWLSYALRLLIGGMITGAPRRTSVQLATSQMGDFLVLTGRSSATRTGPGEPVLGKTAHSEPEPADEEAASIQMMMCKRIIELHAGQLRVTSIATDASPLHAPSRIESFTLTLMTSMPANERSHASCADCRHVSQALSFATDMAQLIASTQTTISDRSLTP